VNTCIEHTDADQAAEFSADQKAQAVVWAGFQWWAHSGGADLTNVTRTHDGFREIRLVGEIWGTHLAQRATA
jgi:hypothetical protein